MKHDLQNESGPGAPFYKMWNNITFLLFSFNGATIEVGEWITNFPRSLKGMWLLIHAEIKASPM